MTEPTLSDAPLQPADPVAAAWWRVEAATARIMAAQRALPADAHDDSRALAQLRRAISEMATNIDRTIDALDAEVAPPSPAPIALQAAMGVE